MLEMKPEIICAFFPSNHGNEIRWLNMLSALLIGNSLSNNTAANLVSGEEFIQTRSLVTFIYFDPAPSPSVRSSWPPRLWHGRQWCRLS